MLTRRLEAARCAMSLATAAALAATALRPAGAHGHGIQGPPSGESAPAPGAEDEISSPAPEIARARELAEEGRQLYWNGEHDAAIRAFEAAYELHADPNLLFNIASSYEKLGNYDAALDYLERYEQGAPATEADAIRAKRSELERGKAEQMAAKPVPADVEPPVSGPAPIPLNLPAPVPPEPKPGLLGPGGWALVGVAAAGAGVGLGFGLSSLSHSRRGSEDCTSVGATLRCPVSARSDLRQARNHAIVADVAFGIAIVVSAAALAVLGIRLSRRKRTESSSALSVGPQGARVHF